ncbi:MAG TPA: PD-(D/E)XK nuclease family protein [Spirochaetales bacterium]|nr:PD-(D/E)XK nuclease family protein [Spirochaetales bacterium]HPD80224.1 PD-(D/E)XK nuclease family protein [Spirochaetales bacterium]HQK34812.1 PD-(D/E)XK nuclease family protein [Spirochaetales bacterium]HRV28257.1 PD-(D/E)XK nuclease family protein [Spirochaetia bacterium]
MKRFLESVASTIYNDLYQNKSVLVIVPNIRSGIFLKHYILQKTQRAVFAPDIFSSEQFASTFSGLEAIENFEVILKLYNIYINSTQNTKTDQFKKSSDTALSIGEFFPLANVLLSDFDEIDRYCIDAKKLFMRIYDNALTSNLYDKLKKIWMQFSNLYFTIKDELVSSGSGYTGLRYRTMLEKIQETSLPYNTVYWVGLYALTQSEKQLFTFFRERYASNFKVFLDLDAYFIENDEQEAGAIYRNFWKKQLLPDISNEFIHKPIDIHAISTQGSIGIVKCAGSIIADIFNKNPDIDPTSIAIVFSDESLLMPMLNTIPEQIKEFNVTMGLPMTITKLYSFLSILFDVYNSMQTNDKEIPEADSLRIRELLEHSYMELLVKNNKSEFNDINNQLNDLIAKNYSYISVDIFKPITHIYNFLQSHDGIAALDEIEKIILSILHKSHEQKLIFETEIIYAGWELINKLCTMFHKNNLSISVRDLYEILNTLFLSKTIAFKGEPLKGLQLMGMLETQCLDFSILIMLSANEGYLPFTNRGKSFIPENLRKEFGLPTQTNSEEVTAYHFYRLISHADSVYLIYSEANETLAKSEKSRFIYQLKYEYIQSNPNCTFTEETFAFPMVKQTKKTIVIESNDTIKNILLNISYSPSALACFNECSLKFYYKYIMYIKEPQELQEDPDAAMIGNIFHTSLKNLFSLKSYTKDDLLSLKNKIEITVNNAIKKYLPNTMFQGNHYVLQKAAVYFLEQYIKNSIEYSERINSDSLKELYTVLATEKLFTHTLTIDTKAISIEGTIDRIDIIGEKPVIIDFKTGAVKGLTISGDTIEEVFALLRQPTRKQALQLLLYALLFSKSNKLSFDKEQGLACSIYSFKNKNGFEQLTIKVQKQEIPINSQLLENFECWLKIFLKEIIDTPVFTQTADTKICQLCPYNSMCMRI